MCFLQMKSVVLILIGIGVFDLMHDIRNLVPSPMTVPKEDDLILEDAHI